MHIIVKAFQSRYTENGGLAVKTQYRYIEFFMSEIFGQFDRQILPFCQICIQFPTFYRFYHFESFITVCHESSLCFDCWSRFSYFAIWRVQNIRTTLTVMFKCFKVFMSFHSFFQFVRLYNFGAFFSIMYFRDLKHFVSFDNLLCGQFCQCRLFPQYLVF